MEKASPGKVHVYFIGDTVELRREFLNGGLDEKDIRKAAFSGLAKDFPRYRLESARARVYPDMEPIGILAGGLVYKATVARPQIDDHAFCGRD